MGQRLQKNRSIRGSALIYILIAIALLALLTATFMGSSDQNQSGQRTFDLVTAIKGQTETVRAAIQECLLLYPDGDKVMPPAPALVGGLPVTRLYPLSPGNSYLTDPVPDSDNLDKIRCPGNPGNSNNHARIFSSQSGKFLPPAPPNIWRHYTNTADGAYIIFGAWKSDSYTLTSFQKINEQYAPCQVDIIDGRTGAKNIGGVDDPYTICDLGNLCLRMWIVMNPASANLPDEPGCPGP